MTVFKYFFRILKSSLPIVLIYLVIFTVMSVMMSDSSRSSDLSQQSFNNYSADVTVINRDNSELGKRLKSYLGTIHNIVELPDEKERLQDELFYRNTSYILIIPEGFQESVVSGEFLVPLENIKVPDSTTGTYVDTQINQYLRQINIYLSSGFTLQQAADLADEAMLEETNVQVLKESTGVETEGSYYYRFLGYIIIAVMISSISPILLAFNRDGISTRMESSPFKLRRKNLQLFMATALLSLVYWILFNALAVIVYGTELFSTAGLYTIINTLALTAVSSAIAFLVGTVAKKRIAVTALSTVFSLGMAFLCGAFVPLEYISESVLTFSKFLPLYWYITNTNLLAQTVTIDSAAKGIIIQNIGIQLIFVVAIISVALVLSKYKKQRFAH